MVEDMDEAAVYGSPMYLLLDDALNTTNPESEDSSDGDSMEKSITEEIASGTLHVDGNYVNAVRCRGRVTGLCWVFR